MKEESSFTHFSPRAESAAPLPLLHEFRCWWDKVLRTSGSFLHPPLWLAQGLWGLKSVVRGSRRERAVEGSCCQYRPISCLAPESLNLGCLIPLEAALLKQAL